MPPRVVTTPDEQDLANLISDVHAAKERPDAVVLSLRWGVHFVPRVIADYQRTVAQAAFDDGADLILGHHVHVPKAIEVLDGKTCFCSLSNFIMTSDPNVPQRDRRGGRVRAQLRSATGSRLSPHALWR
ncbi:MAG: CapA family protein [Alphaproteobacteria bacterium]|nr:CapA family protein [Alphaproteobacteria bacterium]